MLSSKKPVRYDLKAYLLSDTKTVDEFEKIPRGTTELNLAFEYLERKSVQRVIIALQSIPSTVTTLVLNRNNFSSKTLPDWISILGQVPEQIKTVHFGKKLFSSADRAALFTALPQTVEHITYNDERGNLIYAQRDELQTTAATGRYSPSFFAEKAHPEVVSTAVVSATTSPMRQE